LDRNHLRASTFRVVGWVPSIRPFALMRGRNPSATWTFPQISKTGSMMAARRIMLATLSLLLRDIGAAEARKYPSRHRYHAFHQTASHFAWSQESSTYSQRRMRYRDRGRAHRAWCGWYLRHRLGISDPRLNLARNWARYYGRPMPGHASAASPCGATMSA
jgi:hypothetical protein